MRPLPDLSRVENRNEARVAAALGRFLADHPAWRPSDLDLEDVYAAALNRLPARYRQRGTVVLHEPITDAHIAAVIREAVAQVVRHPTRASG